MILSAIIVLCKHFFKIIKLSQQIKVNTDKNVDSWNFFNYVNVLMFNQNSQ